MNYDNKNLQGTLFRGQDLSGSTFIGADLTGANMRECNIDGCDFTGASMFFSNLKDSVGTADFTDAKVYGCPKGAGWNDFVGADFTSTPPLNDLAVDVMLQEIVKQTPSADLDIFTEADKQIISNWSNGDGTTGTLTGSYPDTDRGRNLYNSLPDIDVGGTLPMEEVLNEAMKTNLGFDSSTSEFYTP